MIAKIIAHGPTREAALARLRRLSSEASSQVLQTNLSFLAALCRAPEFRAGGVDTGFIDRNLAALVSKDRDSAAAASGIAMLIAQDRAWSAERGGRAAPGNASPGNATPWDAADGFELVGRRRLRPPFLIDGEAVTAEVAFGPDGLSVVVDGTAPDPDAATFADLDAVFVVRRGRQTLVRRAGQAGAAAPTEAGDGTVRAPMHGKLLAVLVAQGEVVVPGQRLAIVEAMKMEHALTAPCAGTISAVSAAPGAQVAEGAVLITIEPAA